MFIWTGGMHPGVALIFFVIGLVFVVYSLSGAVRWWNWDHENGAMAGPRRGVMGDRHSPRDWDCTNARCQAPNPRHARFCRKCGRPKPSP